MLEVQVKKFETVAVICLRGQIVNGETEILRNTFHSLLEPQPEVTAIKLDFARVTIVDAGGLGVMLALREQVQAKGIRFELMNVTKHVSMVLKLSCLDTVFRITPGVEFFPGVSHGQRARLAHLASCA